MSSLINKVALITGVSRKKSIGFGIANQLASNGANLFLHSFIKYDKMNSLEDGIRDYVTNYLNTPDPYL